MDGCLEVQRIRDHFAHGATTLPAIELAAMMRLNSLRAARTGFDRFADAFFIDIATNANDHANHLQQLRMIVKNDSQLQLNKPGARNGWLRSQPIGKVRS